MVERQVSRDELIDGAESYLDLAREDFEEGKYGALQTVQKAHDYIEMIDGPDTIMCAAIRVVIKRLLRGDPDWEKHLDNLGKRLGNLRDGGKGVTTE